MSILYGNSIEPIKTTNHHENYMKTDKGKNMSDEVVKTNRLNTALQNLSLTEIRLVQLAIVDARETQTGITADKALRIEAKRYADAFHVDINTAYDVLLSAESTLFERRFSFISDRGNPVKSRWISQVEYIKGEGAIEITLTPEVVKEITRIDGAKTPFTKYLIEQTAALNSVYSVRLYELLVQHRTNKSKPKFELEVFRGQLGLGVNNYKRLCDFKRRVLDHGVNEVNEKTDLNISYEPIKKGRTVIGYKFTVLEKPKAKTDKPVPQFKPLTAKTIDKFSGDLAEDNVFGSKHGIVGESTNALKIRLKEELKDVNNQQKWLPDLIRVGYNINY